MREKFRQNKGERTSQPQLVGALVQKVLKELGVEEKFSAAQIVSQWTEIVGEVVGQNTCPERVDNGVLFVNVSNSAWLMELRRFYTDTILKNIKNKIHNASITNIVFKLGPIQDYQIR